MPALVSFPGMVSYIVKRLEILGFYHIKYSKISILVQNFPHKSHEFQHDLTENQFNSKEKGRVRITFFFAVLL